jgi:hypothetical protein
MSEKTRGSDQLKQQYPGLSTLTPEELEQVTGGALLQWYRDSFPLGTPNPLVRLQVPGHEFLNPAIGEMGPIYR